MRINKPQSVEERKDSLRLWQHSENHEFNLQEFALAGFFFEHSFDINDDPGRLRCAFCPAVIGNWQPEDDPWTEHALSVDHCPHVMLHKGKEFVERVKQKEEELTDIEDDLNDCINPDGTNCELHFEQTTGIGLFGIPMSAIRHEHNISSHINCEERLTAAEEDISSRKHGCDGIHKKSGQKQGVSDRNMDCKEARLASFDHVRHLIENDTLLNQVAESGLYFEGINAHGIKARCYSCHCALYNICENDDLWTVHAQMADCAHVINIKGQDFIQKAQIKDTGDNQETETSSECQAKKRKQCDSPENNLELDTENENNERQTTKRKQCDTTGNNFETGIVKKPCTQRSVQTKEHNINKTASGIVKKPCTQRSVQNKKHDAMNTVSGCKRRPRFYSFNGRWCPIKWRPLVSYSPFGRLRGINGEPRHSSGNIDWGEGTNADEVVFLCCRLKVSRRNLGQGPCPCCLQDKFV